VSTSPRQLAGVGVDAVRHSVGVDLHAVVVDAPDRPGNSSPEAPPLWSPFPIPTCPMAVGYIGLMYTDTDIAGRASVPRSRWPSTGSGNAASSASS